MGQVAYYLLCHHGPRLHRLTASSRGNMFLPIYVTLWDAQNWSNNCNLYAKGFPYQSSLHTLHFYGSCKYVFVTNVSRT